MTEILFDSEQLSQEVLEKLAAAGTKIEIAEAKRQDQEENEDRKAAVQ